MKMMRTQKTLTFLLLLSFIFAEVSESAKVGGDFITGWLNKNPDLFKIFPFVAKSQRDGKIDVQKLTKKGEKAKEDIDDVTDAIENLAEKYSLLQQNSPNVSDIQSEISKIQANFNLKVTGKPDLDTMKILSKPRCDFPDKINGTRTYKKVYKKLISLKPWWINEKKKNITYAFGNNVPGKVKLLFKFVFKRWSNVRALKFTETKVFKDSDILIAFVKTDGKGGMVGSWDCIVGI